MEIYRKAALLLGCVLFAAGGAPAAAQPVADTGPATLQPEAEDDNLQWAASVIRIDELRQQGANTVKLFGSAGGDPAMNGLYTYLAFFVSTADGWRIFKIGDFLDYRVISESRGRVLLAINESTMDSQSNIGSRRRRVAVTWTPGPDGAAPTSIRVVTVR